MSTQTIQLTLKDFVAAHEYYARKERKSHPDGRFDKAGRWYPSKDESMPCCTEIREPSRAYPFSLMVHCRTLKHVSNLFGVSESQVRKALQLFSKDVKDIAFVEFVRVKFLSEMDTAVDPERIKVLRLQYELTRESRK